MRAFLEPSANQNIDLNKLSEKLFFDQLPSQVRSILADSLQSSLQLTGQRADNILSNMQSSQAVNLHFCTTTLQPNVEAKKC